MRSRGQFSRSKRRIVLLMYYPITEFFFCRRASFIIAAAASSSEEWTASSAPFLACTPGSAAGTVEPPGADKIDAKGAFDDKDGGTLRIDVLAVTSELAACSRLLNLLSTRFCLSLLMV